MPKTQISDLVNPQVMADMISAKINERLVVAPFARVDESLVGVPGDTIVVPQYRYIGDAVDVAEGDEVDTTKLITTTTQATVKKAMKAVELTDEAVLSGYGNPIGETNNQLALAIAAKVDMDAMDALLSADFTYTGDDVVTYDGIVDAIDVFMEEVNSQKVIFVHPKQLTQLRHDPDFISADKYTGNLIMSGEVGMIANCRVVPSKKVPLNEEISAGYITCISTNPDALLVVSENAADGEVLLSDVLDDLPDAAIGDYVRYVDAVSAGTYYINPIVKLNSELDSEDDAPALTIYLKRDTNVEAQRQTLKRITDISVDKFYTVALSNTSKVVLAWFEAVK